MFAAVKHGPDVITQVKVFNTQEEAETQINAWFGEHARQILTDIQNDFVIRESEGKGSSCGSACNSASCSCNDENYEFFHNWVSGIYSTYSKTVEENTIRIEDVYLEVIFEVVLIP